MARLRLLIVEDDRETAMLLQRQLTPLYDVDVAASNNRAIELLSGARNGSSYGLVLYDLTLPDTRGREAEGLRRLLRKTSAPVVIFTGSDDLDLLQQCIMAGAAAVVRKPGDRVDLRLRLLEAAARPCGSRMDAGRAVERALDRAVDLAIESWPRRPAPVP